MATRRPSITRALLARRLSVAATVAIIGVMSDSPALAVVPDDFERTSIGRQWAKVRGPLTITSDTSHSGARSLHVPAGPGARYLEAHHRGGRLQLDVTFSFRREGTDAQEILRFVDNRLRLIDAGTGRLVLVRGRARTPLAVVTRPGAWNRVRLSLDSRRDRMRAVVGDARGGRWVTLRGARRERILRLGPSLGATRAIHFDAVNHPLRPRPAVSVQGSMPVVPAPVEASLPPVADQTRIWHTGEDWTINGVVTYPGTGAEGTLQSIRATQAIFDDTNPETLPLWAYPDTGRWDPVRNTDELVAQLPSWRRSGINAITISMQGGSPERAELYSPPYSYPRSAFTGSSQLPVVSGYGPDGSIKPAWRQRAERVIEAADDQGIVVILSSLYFGQNARLPNYDQKARGRAIRDTAAWIRERGYTNVIHEVANEVFSEVAHELVRIAQDEHPGLLVGSSMSPVHRFRFTADYWRIAGFTMLHGNGRELHDPTPGDGDDDSIVGDIARARSLTPGRPLHINEDSAWRLTTHAQASERINTLNALGVGNGYYDQEGFQSPAVNWTSDTGPKTTFFARVRASTSPG